MSKVLIGILIAFGAMIIVGLPIFFNLTPTGKSVWNNWFHTVQTADDNTNYETKKQVEDTCRSMLATYNSDKLRYQQYKNSKDAEKQNWAEQAKMRANSTASTYNNYIMKNSYVWKNNIPPDIVMALPYIEDGGQ